MLELPDWNWGSVVDAIVMTVGSLSRPKRNNVTGYIVHNQKQSKTRNNSVMRSALIGFPLFP